MMWIRLAFLGGIVGAIYGVVMSFIDDAES